MYFIEACNFDYHAVMFSRTEPVTAIQNTDVRSASHRLTIAVSAGGVVGAAIDVESTIVLSVKESGYPLLDLVPEPLSVSVDTGNGPKPTSLDLVALVNGQTTVSYARRLGANIAAGTSATLVVTHRLAIEPSRAATTVSPAGPIERDGDGLFAFFEFTDQVERGYLERYLISSFEHDQHAVTIEVRFAKEPSEPHSLFTNGQPWHQSVSTQWVSVTFPEWYTCSSPFFLLARTSQLSLSRRFVPGRPDFVLLEHVADARSAPSRADDLALSIPEILGFVETALGAFPHAPNRPGRERMLLFYRARSSMEYVGAATINDQRYSLFHELSHQLLGRWVMPASGAAGWLDEAVAEWLYLSSGPTRRSPPVATRPARPRSLSAHAGRRSPSSGYDEGATLLLALEHRVGRQALFDALGDMVAKHAKRVLAPQDLTDALIAGFSDPAHRATVRQLLTVYTQPTAAQTPLLALLDEVTASSTRDEKQRAFLEDPEALLATAKIEPSQYPTLFTLDPGVIIGFARSHGALSDAQIEALSRRLEEELQRPRGRVLPVDGLRPEAGGAAGAGGWPHPRARVVAVDTAELDAKDGVQLEIRGDGFVAQSAGGNLPGMVDIEVRLVDLADPTIYHRAVHTERPRAPAEFLGRTVRARFDLAKKAGEYYIEVYNAPGLPPIVGGPVIVVT